MTNTINMTNKIFTKFLFVCFFLQACLLSAQINPYTPDNIIITYDKGATSTDIEDVHDYYGITVFEVISLHGVTREVWTIDFPVIITTDGIGSEDLLDDPIVLETIEELLNFMAINPENTENDGGIVVNDYDLNYVLQIGGGSGSSTNYVLNPVPNCPNDLYRIAGAPADNFSSFVRIIVLDQMISDEAYFGGLLPPVGIIPIGDDLGGTHGNKVASIIKHTLDAAGMTNFRLATLGVFDQDGLATYDVLLKAFAHLDEMGIHDCIINMSASVVMEAGDENFPENMWEDIDGFLKANDMLLISSSSNDGGAMPANNGNLVVYPSAAGLANELTVTGLTNCYETMAPFSLANNQHFEIGAQAQDILVWDGTNYLLEDGNSYATALVSAAAAEVVSEMGYFQAGHIKARLLAGSDVNPNLVNSIKGGRVLNVTATLANISNNGLQANNELGAQETAEIGRTHDEAQVQVSPNPFTDRLNISFGDLTKHAAVSLQLFNLNGQLIMQEKIQGVETMEWNIPADITSGSYLLRIATSEQVISHRILKL